MRTIFKQTLSANKPNTKLSFLNKLAYPVSTYNLTCRNIYNFVRGKQSKSTAAEVEQIWKQVSQNTILKELQIIDYSNINQMSGGGRSQLVIDYIQAKADLITKLLEYIQYVSSNRVKIDKYLIKVDITADKVIQQLNQIILSLDSYVKDLLNIEIHQLKAKYEVLHSMHIFLSNKIHQTDQVLTKISFILEAEIKLKAGLLFFKQYNHQSDITNSPISHYQKVWDRIHIQSTENHKQIMDDYASLSQIFHMMSGAVMKASKYKETILQNIIFGITFPLHMIKYEWSLLKSLQLIRNPTIENGKKFMNLYQDGVMKFITNMSYDKIKTNTMIYIPAEGEFTQKYDIFTFNKDAIPVRILFDNDLPIIDPKNITQANQIQDVLIHIHGGGFVGLSSHTSQNYTRKWSKGLNMVVFSIDYRMPPSHPFPQAPYDCLQVYKFIINELPKYIKINPKNIYFGGDSAGGNLCCGLTTLIIKNQLRLPNALYLVYPCTDLRSIHYPSRKYLLSDPLLWPSMVKMFLNAYIGNDAEAQNPLASPLLLTEQSVGGAKGDKRFPLKWPKTYITVGMKDPLRDESLLLMQRMTESNIDCKCYIFQHLRHGYLSTQKLVKESTVAINHSIDSLKQMISQAKKQGK